MKIREQFNRKSSGQTPTSPPAMKPVKYVSTLYELVLRRTADPAGLDTFTSLIRTTGDPTAVLKAMLDSDEYRMVSDSQLAPEELQRRLESAWQLIRNRVSTEPSADQSPPKNVISMVNGLVRSAVGSPSQWLKEVFGRQNDRDFLIGCFEIVNDGLPRACDITPLVKLLGTDQERNETASVASNHQIAHLLTQLQPEPLGISETVFRPRLWVFAELIAGALSEPQKIAWIARAQGAEARANSEHRELVQLGDGPFFSASDWFSDYKTALASYEVSATPPRESDIANHGAPSPANLDVPLVSVICSLYRGMSYIRPYLENITSQIDFDSCELIIIDANSPEREEEVIREFQQQFPNIIYRRMDSRIGIYEAWNVGIKMSRGGYVTNANLDDNRAPDSLIVAAEYLDKHPDVDVVYGDYHYSLVPHAPWDVIEGLGYTTDSPRLTTYNLLDHNHPHSAPVWRRTLHDECGWFDIDLASASDWEFWLRCAAANKRFKKLPQPISVYYFNPEGMSSARTSVGPLEQWGIRDRYRELLTSEEKSLEPADET